MKYLNLRILPLLLLSIVGQQGTESARILGLFPFQGKSHFVMFESLMQGLAKKGHQVDVVSHFPQKTPIPGYTDLSIKGSLPIFVNNMTIDIVESMTRTGGVFFIMQQAGVEVCETVVKTDIVKQLKTTTVKYDVIVTEIFGTDCLVPFGHYLNIPVIGMISSVPLPWGNDRFGNPDNPSFIPSYLLPLMAPMSLPNRILNTVTTVLAKVAYYYYSTKPTEAIAREFFGSDMPSLYDLTNQMSIMLVNSHYSMSGARPVPPNVAEVGGIHIKPNKQLPEKFAKVMNAAKNGVIYFSLGSMVRTESFTQEKKRALLDAMGELPYTIYWKAEADKFEAPIPSNIIFEEWMPQMEILCHPNTKLFLTHGGLMGTQEAVYCGVPMVGMPLFGDQDLNIQTYETFGIAAKLDYNTLSKESILQAIKTVLDNPQYAENIKQKSKLFRDRPETAMNTAIYWVEHVIRHKGASHLRPISADLLWYQLHLLDVAGVLLLVAGVFLGIFYVVVNMVVKKFATHERSKAKKQKRQ